MSVTALKNHEHPRSFPAPWVLIALVIGLALASMFVGVSAVSPTDLWSDGGLSRTIFLQSRLPRTLSVVLAGASIAVTGAIMQALTQNRFVAPSTAGTTEAAVLGIVVISLFAPSAAVWQKMVAATGFALGGTMLFVWFIQRLRNRDIIYVPLVGIMLGAIIESVAIFVAFRSGLLQSMFSWMIGDFSGTISGRYELLYLVGGAMVAAYVIADRFTLAGVGRDFAVNVGLNYDRTVLVGMTIVAIVNGIVVVVVGAVPFLGLIVPNLVSARMGDNQRRVLPTVAGLGAASLLACDIASRTIRYPFEVPVGTIMGVVGGIAFLTMLLRSRT